MKSYSKLLTTILLTLSINAFSQFQYNEYDELKSFSYISKKIIDMKKQNKINSLQLPSYNNDSLYFVKNIQKFLPGYFSNTVGGICGINIDTTIDFFQSATRIKIKEGYVWLFKIQSPTAIEIFFQYKNCSLDTNEYFSIHSNRFDSINGMYDYQLPEVLHETTARNYGDFPPSCNELCSGSLFGNQLYIEYFSENKVVKGKKLEISNIAYGFGYRTSYKLSDAPDWIREKYPDIDFDKDKKEH